jgi:drug/metabolite transporter (DMT)-like permease
LLTAASGHPIVALPQHPTRPFVPLYIVVLVLFSALMHASWNALVKSGRDPFTTQAGIFIVAGIWAAILLPFQPLPAPASLPYLAASVVIHVFYYHFLAEAYVAGDLSMVYPIARGSAPVLVAVLAIPVAGELPTTYQLAGILLVSAGIFSLTPARGAATHRRALLFALATGVTVAGYTVADGTGVRHTGAPMSYITWLFALQGVAFAVVTLIRRGTGGVVATVRDWRRSLVGGTTAVLGYGLVIWAMDRAALAPVSALRETSVIIAALLGTTLLREPFGVRRVIAAIVVCAGAALLGAAG